MIDALKCRNVQSNSASPNLLGNHQLSPSGQVPLKASKQYSRDSDNDTPSQSPLDLSDPPPLTLYSLLGSNKDPRVSQSEMIECDLPNRPVALLKGHHDEVSGVIDE